MSKEVKPREHGRALSPARYSDARPKASVVVPVSGTKDNMSTVSGVMRVYSSLRSRGAVASGTKFDTSPLSIADEAVQSMMTSSGVDIIMKELLTNGLAPGEDEGEAKRLVRCFVTTCVWQGGGGMVVTIAGVYNLCDARTLFT